MKNNHRNNYIRTNQEAIACLHSFVPAMLRGFAYLDEDLDLSDCEAWDLAWDLKGDFAESPFNYITDDEDFDCWFDEFSEEHLVPYLIEMGAIDES